MRSTIYLILLFHLFFKSAKAQDHGFEFGRVSYAELDMKIYDRDTAAVAVVLNEFGEAFFDLTLLNRIVFQYHVKIKVLKEQGKKYADFELVRRKSNSGVEVIRNVKASSFNRDGNKWRESALIPKNIFDEKVNGDYSLTKFAVPDVQVGSVIEVYYELESPYTYNFVPWEFQSDIPKVRSEFLAKYPAYYDYNITLKGMLKLTKNEGELIKQCTQFGSSTADCSVHNFAIDNIPAFKEEEFMTAKRNFLSAVNFELAKINYPDGRVDKITTEWKEAEKELKEHLNFGAQVKKARNIHEAKAKEVSSASSDPLEVAKNLYEYIKGNYLWNGEFGFLTDNGAKKTDELRKGNIADINLSLLAILLEAKLQAEPVLLSTRSRGLPIKLHPVLSDFNYVLVRLKVKESYFLLDATSPLYSFGFIPEHCLNGQGRAIWETSDWIDLKPNAKERKSYELKLKMSNDGMVNGTVTIKHEGYAGLKARSSYFTAKDEPDYIEKRKSSWSGVDVDQFAIENAKEVDAPFIEKFDLKFEDQGTGFDIIYFQPFLFNRILKNPFTSTERHYPVDFGAPTESIYMLTLEVPENYTVEDIPDKVALVLPAGGGRYLFNVTNMNGKLLLTSSLSLNKSAYSSEEYHYLRELYARYINIQGSQFVLKKKK